MENLLSKKKPRKPLKTSGWTKLSSSMIKSLYGAKKWQRMASVGAVVFLLSLGGCGTIKKVEIEHRIETHYVDSTIYHLDTVKVEVPREVYRDYTSLLDTLHMETSVASSWAAVDTTNMVLRGELKNKPIQLEKEILWKEKIVYKDSLVYQEVPIPVEVEKKVTPRWAWFTLGVSVLSILSIILLILKKLKLV